jgi:hypothetical protein
MWLSDAYGPSSNAEVAGVSVASRCERPARLMDVMVWTVGSGHEVTAAKWI